MKPSLSCFLTTLVALGFLSFSAQADFASERFALAAGGAITTLDSKARFDGDYDIGSGVDIDFEDDLGLDEDVDSVWVNASFRFKERHRLAFNYLPMRRSASARLDEALEYEDYDIQANAQVASDTSIDIYDLDYKYSFYQTPSIEAAFGLGIHWLSWDYELNASGAILIEQEDGSFLLDEDGQLTDSSSAELPLPLVGLYFDYQPTQRWLLSLRGRLMDAKISDYDGNIANVAVGAEYFFTRRFALGLGASYFSIDVDTEQDDFRGKLKWTYSSGQLYMNYRY